MDRTLKLVFARIYRRPTKLAAAAFLRVLIKTVPYKIHTILTDNPVLARRISSWWRASPATCATARASPSSLLEADRPGIARRDYRTLSGMFASEIMLSGVVASGHDLPCVDGEALPLIERVVDEATVAICAEAVGVMTRLHADTLAHTQQRSQFGRALSSYQVLQHRMVDMLMMTPHSKSLVARAAEALESSDLERTRLVSATKVYVEKAARFCGQQAFPFSWRHRHNRRTAGRLLFQTRGRDRASVRNHRPSSEPLRTVSLCPACRRLTQMASLINFRDFGGHKTRGAYLVRESRLFLCGQLTNLSVDGLAHLVSCEFTLIADLRFESERRRGPSPWPDDYADRVLFHGEERETEAPHITMLREASISLDRVDECYRNFYGELPLDRRYRPLFAEVIRRLARTGGSLLVHCAAGKDRIGILAALILDALDVPRDEILEVLHAFRAPGAPTCNDGVGPPPMWSRTRRMCNRRDAGREARIP